MNATAMTRRILHGTSQRLVIVAPHTIASGYDRRRASEYAWRMLIGWLLFALFFGAAVCWLLQLPVRPLNEAGIQGSAAGTFCLAAGPTRNEGARLTHGRLQGPVAECLTTSMTFLHCSVDAGPEQLAGARRMTSLRPDFSGVDYAI